jgi:hypothetical protein
MAKYEGFTGTVTKFGRKWRWFRYGHHDVHSKEHVYVFKVEPYYDFDHTIPRPRPTDKNLTLTIEVRGAVYTFPAKRMPCTTCDGGIRRQLGLRPHGGVCYCDFTDGTIITFDYDKMTEQQREIVETYHLDLQASSFW